MYKDETILLGASILNDAIERYEEIIGEKVSNETISAIHFIAGYFTTRLSGEIFIQYIFPLLKEIRIYFLAILSFFCFLIIALILKISSVSINSLIFVIPALVGLLLGFFKVIKLWSEVKKNLAEARKNEAEAKKLELEL